MDDDFAKDARPQHRGSDAQSTKDTLEADVLEETDKQKKTRADKDEVLLSDVAVTAEFDYIDLDDESDASDAQKAPAADEPSAKPAMPAGITKARGPKSKPPGDDGGPITRALHDFDSYLDDGGEAELAAPSHRPGLVNDPNLSSNGAWGFDQPQVSGVFSRYEEETREGDSDDFDLFEDDEGEQPRDRTLQDIVNAHEKQIRRLEKRLVYQKEVIQVVSELLVEARVISKRELKKRLRALRDKG